MEKHERPSWDEYFMKLANEVATRTTCLRRGVGALIVKERRIWQRDTTECQLV